MTYTTKTKDNKMFLIGLTVVILPKRCLERENNNLHYKYTQIVSFYLLSSNCFQQNAAGNTSCMPLRTVFD